MSLSDILALSGVLLIAGSLLYWMYKSNKSDIHHTS